MICSSMSLLRLDCPYSVLKKGPYSPLGEIRDLKRGTQPGIALRSFTSKLIS